MSAAIGQPAPSFELPDQDRNPVTLESLKGNKSLVVFIPFPFTGNCEAELCTIRDQRGRLNDLDANVVAISCDTLFANKEWSDKNGFGFPVLSDFWPHGQTAKAYGAFNEAVGAANRWTFVLDADGIIRDIVNTESLGVVREFEAVVEALEAIDS